MKAFVTFLFLICSVSTFAQWPSNYSPTYEELMNYYESVAKQYKGVELYQMGTSDSGKPIHLIILNGAQDSTLTFDKCRKETTILINNGIHPGEPDGINACTELVEQIVRGKLKVSELPVIAIIPVYNVGGMLNRGHTSRANQNGPDEYGFRGNASNLDLNRDFIKMDSRNAATFVKIFQAVNPDVFVDTHVSNGADYQYTLTLIHSLRQRQMPAMQSLMQEKYLPELNQFAKKSKWDWSPYVETKAEIPDSGIVAFDDLPRYAQGYAALFHCLSVTVETHMLKPFDQRVKATYDYLYFLIKWTKTTSEAIEQARKTAIIEANKSTFARHHYKLLPSFDSIVFRGYTAEYPISVLTGMPRLKYNRTKPFTKKVPFYNHYEATDSVRLPQYYLVSSANKTVIDRLKLNGVEFQLVPNDTVMLLHTIRIVEYQTGSKPYEGHYLHTQIQTEEQLDSTQVLAGSLLIPSNQDRRQFIVSVLEPEFEDSYFAWNFMDSYVQGKEYFSAYVFEDLALSILENNPRLKQDFNEKRKNDVEFRNNPEKQLYFIYKNSPYFEKSTFMRLPVFKIY